MPSVACRDNFTKIATILQEVADTIKAKFLGPYLRSVASFSQVSRCCVQQTVTFSE